MQTIRCALVLVFALSSSRIMAADGEAPLRAGWAVAEITPAKPVNLVGQ
jgi:hypothetical protein